MTVYNRSFVVSAFCKIINWLIYGFVTHAAAAQHALHIISDVSKLEGWWMASMHITNSRFKTFFRASCGFIGPKTPKIRPKRAQNQPEDPNLAIKLERKVLETPFWYQTKALHEQSLNKLFWQQINIHKHSVQKSQKHDFWLKNSHFQTPD